MTTRVSDYVTQYNAKDVMLYAISIGLGSTSDKYNQDLRFVFEGHHEFTVFPTFALTLPFWATTAAGSTNGDRSSIGPFPPPLMKAMGIIPAECLREDVDLDLYQIIHTSHSIFWNRDMPIPKDTNIIIHVTGKFISVIPKSVGTFVTTEYEFYEWQNGGVSEPSLLCSIQSTTLIFGIASEVVHPFQSPATSFQIDYSPIFLQRNKTLLFENDCCITPNTALLYRLASGDTNHIHVDSKAVQMFHSSVKSGSSNGERSQLLHGLCTLSIATRIILQFLDDDLPHRDSRPSVQYLSAKFVKPVFVSDTIVVQAWELESSLNIEGVLISFVVRRKKSDEVLLDSGLLQLLNIAKRKPFANTRSYI
jgi:acyl dehydratase